MHREQPLPRSGFVTTDDTVQPLVATKEMITTKGAKTTKERSWRRIDIHAKAQRRKEAGVGVMRF
jgi:hypothetical protein